MEVPLIPDEGVTPDPAKNPPCFPVAEVITVKPVVVSIDPPEAVAVAAPDAEPQIFEDQWL